MVVESLKAMGTMGRRGWRLSGTSEFFDHSLSSITYFIGILKCLY